MEYIKNFIITLVITMIFMTAVEIIAPDNSIKKYIKFILGLILVSVMINPIISFFSGGEQKVLETIKSYENMLYEDTTKNTATNSITDTQIESFKSNLNKNCESMLKSQFSEKNFESNIECTLDLDEMTYTIDKVEVGVEDKGIKVVEKVKIDLDEAEEAMSKEEYIEDEEEIKNYLADLFGISVDKIILYSLGG